jgi:hypothetical protein
VALHGTCWTEAGGRSVHRCATLGGGGWRLALSAQAAAAAANCLGNERPLERRAPVFRLIDDFSAKTAHSHRK